MTGRNGATRRGAAPAHCHTCARGGATSSATTAASAASAASSGTTTPAAGPGSSPGATSAGATRRRRRHPSSPAVAAAVLRPRALRPQQVGHAAARRRQALGGGRHSGRCGNQELERAKPLTSGVPAYIERCVRKGDRFSRRVVHRGCSVRHAAGARLIHVSTDCVYAIARWRAPCTRIGRPESAC